MAALDGPAPVPCGRLAGLVHHDTVVTDGLGEVVGKVLAVVKLLVARPGIEGEVPAVVDDEVERVVMAVLREDAAAREEAVGGAGIRSRAHEDLPHVLEVPGMGQPRR